MRIDCECGVTYPSEFFPKCPGCRLRVVEATRKYTINAFEHHTRELESLAEQLNEKIRAHKEDIASLVKRKQALLAYFGGAAYKDKSKKEHYDKMKKLFVYKR